VQPHGARDAARPGGDRDLTRADQPGELGRGRARGPVAPEAALRDRVDVVDENSQVVEEPGVVGDPRL